MREVKTVDKIASPESLYIPLKWQWVFPAHMFGECQDRYACTPFAVCILYGVVIVAIVFTKFEDSDKSVQPGQRQYMRICTRTKAPFCLVKISIFLSTAHS